MMGQSTSRLALIGEDDTERWMLQRRSKQGHLCCVYCAKTIPPRQRKWDTDERKVYFCSAQHAVWFAEACAEQLVRRPEDLEAEAEPGG